MRKLCVPILLVFSLLLCSCVVSGGGDSNQDNVNVYRMVRPEHQTDGELLKADPVTLGESADPVQSAVYAIASTPDDDKLMCALPQGVKILSAELKGAVVNVYLNSAYLSLSGVEKTITNYAITLTMCSFAKVDFVSICVGNDILQSRLSAEDIVLKNTVVSPTEGEVRLFFPRASSYGLGSEYRKLILEAENHAERQLMDQLLLGPSDVSLLTALPEDTVLLSIYTRDGLCSVSFSDSFLSGDDITAEQARLAIYSVVNSLASLSYVDSVQILIEGKTVSYICGVDVSHPLTKNTKLISAIATA